MSISIYAKRDCDIQDLIRRGQLIENIPNAEVRLRRWIRVSDQVWIGMHDDKVACVWGLAPPSAISNRAYLWLLTTEIVDQHKFLFIRHSQMVIEQALELYPTIVGHVEVGNERAKRWLRWLGAAFEPPLEGFCPFVIKRRK